MGQSRIDAGAIPIPDLDAAALTTAAGGVKSHAGGIRRAGADIKSSWAGLSAFYDAPEAGDLFAAMDPVATKTDAVADDAEKVAAALTTFAAEAGPLKATLVSTKAKAQAFSDRTASDGEWDHRQSNVDENNGYVHAVNTTLVAFQAAERKCANTIEALFGGTQWHTVGHGDDKTAYGYDSIPDNAKTPWGSKVEKKDGCVKSSLTHVGHFFQGAGEAVWGMVTGLGDLVGFGGWEKFKQSWAGLSEFGSTISIIGGIARFGWSGWVDHLKMYGKGFTHWDEWHSDPSKAAGASVVDVATFLIPMSKAGKLGTVGKGSEEAGNLGKLDRAANAAKNAVKVLDEAINPARVLEKFPKVKDIASTFTDKLPSFGRAGTTTLDKTMAEWDNLGKHDPVPAGTHPGGGDHPGTSTHPGTGDHPGTGTPSGNDGHPGTASHPGVGDQPILPKGQDLQPWEQRGFAAPVGTQDLKTVSGDHPPVHVSTTNANTLGQYGEKLTQAELERNGWQVVFHGRHVEMPGGKGYFVPDFIAIKDGHAIAVESKFGSGAHFTPGQLQGYDKLAHGDPLVARSTKMQEVLDQYRITRVDGVQVYRWNTEFVPDADLIRRAGLDKVLTP